MKAATIDINYEHTLYFISIHAAREGGDHCGFLFLVCQPISIHAAREGGDQGVTAVYTVTTISIHAAREGGDNIGVALYATTTRFQSTPPVKAATSSEPVKAKMEKNFNPRRP